MKRARNGLGTVRLALVVAAMALTACVAEPVPAESGYYAWYEGPYYPPRRYDGASGSWHTSAKLRVLLGAPDHASGGEESAPSHVKPLGI